jgi:16S rRNA (guanine527-N7)-methyltransferase
MDEILKYFPNLTDIQKGAIRKVGLLYHDWNEKNKCYFEKDIDALYTKHILHSLGIAKIIDFVPGTYVLDVELVVDLEFHYYFFRKRVFI